jgi:hypothetical protein
VRDATGQALAHLYSRANATEALQAEMLTEGRGATGFRFCNDARMNAPQWRSASGLAAHRCSAPAAASQGHQCTSHGTGGDHRMARQRLLVKPVEGVKVGCSGLCKELRSQSCHQANDGRSLNVSHSTISRL